MSAMAPHITGVSIVAEVFVHSQIKENNIKSSRHWPLLRESTDDK